ncbi:MAG TPA: NAD(P)H-dependent oxidoreductase [Candidatus Sulfotelmatobacter sp.]|nr:NAD(P)H-dependent oxidoreductase [Candidatus Sulfotelmatobacter sp.]
MSQTPARSVVILDGCGSSDEKLFPILDLLSDVFCAQGAAIQVFTLRETKLAHCLGCFDCWLKTPGVCVEADAGRDIAKAIIRSDATVLFTPVTFGGYSPELKKMMDRFIQLIPPLFHLDHGEVHHPPRYPRRPRLLMVGVQQHANAAEAHIFKTLAGRNAINFHPPSYAVEVVLASDDLSVLRCRFESLLLRSDSLPFGEPAASLMPPALSPSAASSPAERRALLLVGSPKTKEPSTSGALAGFLAHRLEEQGWETNTLTLRASVNRQEGQTELLSAVARAALVLLVFPLYVDSLPYLVTKSLTIIAHDRASQDSPPLPRFAAVVNSGFPESHQNAVALAICQEFATQAHFQWAGGLALGGGAMIGGQPLVEAARSGPPIRHVIAALERTADSLAQGFPVPAEAMSLVAKTPVPAAVWKRFYVWMGSRSMKQQAAKNGINQDQLLARPYAA